MSPSGLKFRNQRDYFRTNFKKREQSILEEEEKMLKETIEAIPDGEPIWPKRILEIYNCD